MAERLKSLVVGIGSFLAILALAMSALAVATWLRWVEPSPLVAVLTVTTAFLFWSIIPRKWIAHTATIWSAIALCMAVCVIIGLRAIQVRHLGAAMHSVTACGGKLFLDYEWDTPYLKTRNGWVVPSMLRDFLGDEWFGTVEHVLLREVNDDHVPDLDLRPFTSVEFTGAPITDASLPAIAENHQLQCLGLSYTSITDEGIRCLEALPSLSELWLTGTSASDDCIESLQKLQALKRLVLTETNITDAGLARLRRALPRCQIIRSQ